MTWRPKRSTVLAEIGEDIDSGALKARPKDREFLIRQIAFHEEWEAGQEIVKHQGGNVHVGPWGADEDEHGEVPC